MLSFKDWLQVYGSIKSVLKTYRRIPLLLGAAFFSQMLDVPFSERFPLVSLLLPPMNAHSVQLYSDLWKCKFMFIEYPVATYISQIHPRVKFGVFCCEPNSPAGSQFALLPWAYLIHLSFSVHWWKYSKVSAPCFFFF